MKVKTTRNVDMALAFGINEEREFKLAWETKKVYDAALEQSKKLIESAKETYVKEKSAKKKEAIRTKTFDSMMELVSKSGMVSKLAEFADSNEELAYMTIHAVHICEAVREEMKEYLAERIGEEIVEGGMKNIEQLLETLKKKNKKAKAE
jgi:hypothetical protein